MLPKKSRRIRGSRGGDLANSSENKLTTDYRSFSAPTNVPTTTASAVKPPLALPPSIHNVSHRGFSTSIHDLGEDVALERVDCCALTCCGILQSDRDRYLVTGVTPPGPMKRLAVHILLPLTAFVLAGYGATHIADPYLNQTICVLLLLIMLSFCVLQCQKGSMKRTAVRKDLLFTKYQLQSNPDRLELALDQERPEDDDYDDDLDYYLGQRHGDFQEAHSCCLFGCYKEDRTEHIPSKRDNLCSCCLRVVSTGICGWHLQCCGTCALAQEARELETAVLPASYRRIDYVTMQPYMEYYPAIYQAKWRDARTATLSDTGDLSKSGNSIGNLRQTLSALSVRILQWLGVFVGMAFAWSLLSPLYWKYVANIHHRSFDMRDFAVLILTIGETVGLLALIVYGVNKPKYSALSIDAMIKFFASGFLLSTSLAVFWEVLFGIIVKLIVRFCLELAGVEMVEDPETTLVRSPLGNYLMADTAQDFLRSAGKNHPVLYTIYILFATFCLAALIEEICKYFGYRMVEHPDFLSQEELHEAKEIILEEDIDRGEDEFIQQGQSNQQKGAAVTLAMVCTAMGFTCCENLVYVFLYSSSSVQMEISVLIARAFFPVHPICAALQSLGVVRRDVEGESKSFFAILGPAVLFHGAYDFFIVWIEFLASGHKNNNWMSIISFFLSVGLMIAAVCYFLVQAGGQRKRLQGMDHKTTGDAAGLL